MLDWYFSTGKENVWLETSPNTRAGKFYAKAGCTKNGMYGNEVKFEMTKKQWKTISKAINSKTL